MRKSPFPCATKNLRKGDRRSSQRGSTLLEFALIAPLFFLLVCGIFDFGHLFFVQMSMQDAIRQAGRFAVTGNHLPDPNNPGNNLSRVASIIKTAQDASAGTTITGIKISSLNGGSNSAGGPGDTVTVSVTDDLQLVTPLIAQFFGPNGIYTFTVSVTFKNEPFSPSQTL
jgi:Flp pilus assembly protein TadG